MNIENVLVDIPEGGGCGQAPASLTRQSGCHSTEHGRCVLCVLSR